jgi:iron-sulfur cluster repair protein YtfE (RIC family)
MTSSTATLELDCTLTVRHVIERYPATRAVFDRFGVDACCGGGASVEQAARLHDVDGVALCTALRTAAEGL